MRSTRDGTREDSAKTEPRQHRIRKLVGACSADAVVILLPPLSEYRITATIVLDTMYGKYYGTIAGT